MSNVNPVYIHLPFRAVCSKFAVSGHGLFDSGSTHTLIPSSQLPREILEALEPTDQSFTGVSGSTTKALGMFCATLHLCGIELKNIKFYCMPSECPIILGQNVFRHASVGSYQVDYDSKLFIMNFIDAYGKSNRGQCKFEPFQNRLVCTHGKSTFHADNAEGDIDLDLEQGRIVPKTDPSLLTTLTDKLQWLKDELHLPLEHEHRGELERFADLLIEYRAVFGVGDDTLGTFPHEIEIPTNGQSRSAKQHPIPHAHKPIITAEIEKMLKAGVIEPCPDARGFSSPIVTVKKKDGSIRMCLNFKPTLNQVVTDGESFPMESTDGVFAQIPPKMRYFSSMDLFSGYWHCKIAEKDRYKTAFWWNGVCYQYVRLPFGLSISGNIFARQVAAILKDHVTSPHCSIYLDDITVHAPDFEAFIKAHRDIFAALIKNGAKLKPAKCEFLRPSVKFLGRILSKDGYAIDPDNYQGIQSIEPPRTKKQLLSLIGRLLWLKMFIGTKLYENLNLTSFSSLMDPIYELNRSQEKFRWTDAAQNALDKIKKRLSEAPFISFADPNLPYSLTTDASKTGCSGVLMQIRDGKYRVIACISRRFTAVEQRWSTTERECYGIVWAVEKLSHYLMDSKFTIFTDHRSLTYLDRREFDNSKIQNWQHKMSRYRFTVQYLPGQNNHFADWLSRLDNSAQSKKPADSTAAGQFMKLKDSDLHVYIPSWCSGDRPIGQLMLEDANSPGQIAHMAPAVFLSEKCEEELDISPNYLQYIELSKAQREDAFLAPLISALEVRRDSPKTAFKNSIFDYLDEKSEMHIPYKNVVENMFLEPATNVLMIRSNRGSPNRFPQMVVPKSLRAFYLYAAHNNSGHAGRNRVFENLANFWWEGRDNDIRSYLAQCDTCGQRKGRYGKRPLTQGHNERGRAPWEIIYIDFISLPNVRGLKYALTLMDSLTKFVEVYPLAHDRAIDTARCLTKMVLKHGCKPAIISCDRGTHFTGSVMQEFCKNMNIQIKYHVAWRPESSGILERAHRTIKNSLYIMAKERNSNWVDVLDYCTAALNSQFNAATKCSPFWSLYGRHWNVELPDPPTQNAISHDPLAYGMNVSRAASMAQKYVAICNKDADRLLDDKARKMRSKSEIIVGSKVRLYRPRAAENTDKMPWIGEYEVLDTNGLVSKITNGSYTDWVHNSHLCVIPHRIEELEIPESNQPSARVWSLPRYLKLPPRSLPSERGKMVKSEPKVEAKLPEEPRRSTRDRKKTENLQIDPRKKTYALVASSRPAACFKSALYHPK